MSKINVIDELLKKLQQRKKDFLSNQEKIFDYDLSNFNKGVIQGIIEAIDILLDSRIDAQIEFSKSG